jgi:uncharacterized protein YprB with RNaseH-like and TPR domain
MACHPDVLPLSNGASERVARFAEESIERLAAGDACYFERSLPGREVWRMFPEFRSRTAYVDIETTGLGAPGDYITAIGLYDGRRVRHYVHGRNLEEFRGDIEDFELIVTYNGKCFDVPFIRHYLGAPMEHAHIDLRYVLASLGFRGGLKGCEAQLGIDRGELEGVDGYFAVLLWRDFIENDNPKALDTLLAYNSADVLNLETLAVLAYNLRVAGTVFADTHALDVPEPRELSHQPDPETIAGLKAEGWHWGR